MSPLEKFLAALATVGVADLTILAVYFAWVTAPPGAEALNACNSLLKNVGPDKYHELVTTNDVVKEICSPFNLDPITTNSN